jgi:phosphatidate cytidylyltransferase
MNKTAQRLITFLIGIPAIVGIVLFLPYCKHLALNIVIVLLTAAGAVEFSSMLEKKRLRISKPEAFIIGALAPASLVLNINFNLPEWITQAAIMTGAGWTLLPGIFTRYEKIETIANRIAAGFSVLVYPGFFSYWIIKMSVWDNAGVIILIFLLIPLISDSAAWLAGTLLGKNNRGIFKASPNKSIAGFIGGIIGALIITVSALFIIVKAPDINMIFKAVILGFCTGIVGALGDLFESAIKRSCGVKDSGKLMLGRGGVLDSIDSIAVAAPVFYLLFKVLFN